MVVQVVKVVEVLALLKVLEVLVELEGLAVLHLPYLTLSITYYVFVFLYLCVRLL